MARYIVYCNMRFSKIVEAASEDDATLIVGPPPSRGQWDDSECVSYDVEEETE